MGHYIDLSLKEATKIFQLYGISSHSIQKITPLGLGISNSNYRVDTDEGPLLLKVSNDKNVAELKDELNILLFFKEHQFAYSLVPKKMLDEEYVYHLGDYFGMVFPFIEGKPPVINTQSSFQIGMALAQLHLVGVRCLETLIPLRSHDAVGFAAHHLVAYTKNPICPNDFKESFRKVFRDDLKGYISTAFPKGVIHGDLYFDNILCVDGKIQALIDFEQAGVGEFLFDIGVSISGSCLVNGRIDPWLVKEFLRGYQELRELTKVERKYFDTAILVGLFSISLWRIKRFTEGDLDPQKSHSYKELLMRALDYLEQIS